LLEQPSQKKPYEPTQLCCISANMTRELKIAVRCAVCGLKTVILFRNQIIVIINIRTLECLDLRRLQCIQAWYGAIQLTHLLLRIADRTALSGIAEQHADDGYSRRGNFGGSLVRNMVLIYSPDGNNVFGSRGEEFEEKQVGVGVEICKIASLGTFTAGCIVYAQCTASQTDRQSIILRVAVRSAKNYIWLHQCCCSRFLATRSIPRGHPYKTYKQSYGYTARSSFFTERVVLNILEQFACRHRLYHFHVLLARQTRPAWIFWRLEVSAWKDWLGIV